MRHGSNTGSFATDTTHLETLDDHFQVKESVIEARKAGEGDRAIMLSIVREGDARNRVHASTLPESLAGQKRIPVHIPVHVGMRGLDS